MPLGCGRKQAFLTLGLGVGGAPRPSSSVFRRQRPTRSAMPPEGIGSTCLNLRSLRQSLVRPVIV